MNAATVTRAGIQSTTFAPVPSWLCCRREVSQSAKLAYGRLRQFLGQNATAWPSYARLGHEIGISRRQAVNVVRELQRHGLVVVEHRRCSSTHYRLPSHPWADSAGENIAPRPVKPLSPAGEIDCTGDGETYSTQKEKLKTNTKTRERWMIEKDRQSVKDQIARVRSEHSRYNPETFNTELTATGRAKVTKLKGCLKALDGELLEA